MKTGSQKEEKVILSFIIQGKFDYLQRTPLQTFCAQN